MNKQHLEMTNQMGKIMVSYALEDESDLDNIAFKMLRNDCPPFVAGFSTVEINGKVTLRYDVGNMISVAYYSAKLSMGEFTAVWSNLIAPLMQCKDWLLGYNSFCFDPQYIFIDRHTMAVKYIYLPLNSAAADDDDIKSMFMGMMERCELVDGQNLQVELYKLFAQRSFSIEELNAIIQRNMAGTGKLDAAVSVATATYPNTASGNAPVPAPAPPRISAPQVSSAPVPSAEAWKSNDVRLTPEEELEQQLLGSLGSKPGKAVKGTKPEKIKPPKKPLFSFGKKPDKAAAAPIPVPSQPAYTARQQQPAAAQMSMVARVEDDSTVMLDAIGMSQGGGCCLRLVNNSAPADLPRQFAIDFSRGGVSIGRHDASKAIRQSDIEFPASVKSVSRTHARIEQQGANYVVVDLGSANGTFVNGVRIAPNVPTAIRAGDRLSFSDKGIDYVFAS